VTQRTIRVRGNAKVSAANLRYIAGRCWCFRFGYRDLGDNL